MCGVHGSCFRMLENDGRSECLEVNIEVSFYWGGLSSRHTHDLYHIQLSRGHSIFSLSAKGLSLHAQRTLSGGTIEEELQHSNIIHTAEPSLKCNTSFQHIQRMRLFVWTIQPSSTLLTHEVYVLIKNRNSSQAASRSSQRFKGKQAMPTLTWPPPAAPALLTRTADAKP